MSQQQNNIATLLIPDPNGGQPQMIKVVGGTKIPLQLATQSGRAPATVKTFIKTIPNSGGDQGPTLIQANKISNRQIFTLPAKTGLNVQGIRGSFMLPINVKASTQSQSEQLPSTAIITSRPANTVISSPLVIRSQTGSGTATTISSSFPNAITQQHLKTTGNVISSPVLHAQLKTVATTSRPQTFALKTQTVQLQKAENVITVQKPSEQNVIHQMQILKPRQLNQAPHQVAQVQLQALQQKSQVHQRQPYHTATTQSVSTPPKSLMTTSILDHSANRKRQDFDFDYSVESKRRKTEKGGKGLRHFSMKVCEKVKAKGTTSYNEVADELVSEFTDANRSNSPTDSSNYDQKNIRRRVYDALNVLMAMNIISKEKKEIRWLGLPTNSAQECHKLDQDRKKMIQRIKLKTQQLQDLILQQIAFKNLVERNKQMEKENGAPSPNSAIQLPFIIVNTNKKTVIDCSVSNDKTGYLFNFDNTFEIHDDIEVLKRMGLALGLEKGQCTPEDLEKAKALLPRALEEYVTELSEGNPQQVDSNGQDVKPLRGGDLLLQQQQQIDDDDVDDDEDSNSGLNGLYMNAEKDDVISRLSDSQGLSRHSSLASLNQETRTDSVSPSSFGDDDDYPESDIEIT